MINTRVSSVQPREFRFSLTSFCSTDLDHVIKRLLISETETLPDVQHVYLRTGNHDSDQGVVSGTESLQMNQRTVWNTEVQSQSFLQLKIAIV